MPSLERPTVSLHYEDTGAGQPVVFLHGWCDSSATWAATMNEFARDYRCLAPDMRGHGRSGLPFDHAFTPETLTNDLVAVCEAAGVQAPILVGHSYGGYLAAETARRFPGFARAVVVEDQQLALRPFVEQMRSIEPVLRGRDSHMAFRRQWFETMVSPAMPAADRAVIEAAKEATPPDVALGLWALMFEFTLDEISERADALMAALGRQPSLSIESAPAPEYHAALAKLAPSARTAVITSGHWIHLEQPAAFRAAVRAFLGSL